MTSSLTRRLVLVTAALGTALLAACTSPTAPQNNAPKSLGEERSGGVYGGSSTGMCGGGVYGGSSTC